MKNVRSANRVCRREKFSEGVEATRTNSGQSRTEWATAPPGPCGLVAMLRAQRSKGPRQAHYRPDGGQTSRSLNWDHQMITLPRQSQYGTSEMLPCSTLFSGTPETRYNEHVALPCFTHHVWQADCLNSINDRASILLLCEPTSTVQTHFSSTIKKRSATGFASD